MSRIKPMYGGIKLNAAITSDNHVDSNTKLNPKRIKIIRKALKDAENSVQPFDAYVTVGDTTSRGIDANWEGVKTCFDGMKPAKNIFFALGNHDSWDENGYEGYHNGIKNYYKYSKIICSQSLDKPYFERTVNGYHFIFLGSTDVPENEDCACLGDEQIKWLGETLDSAEKDGKPIFIFCHQSVNNLHGLPRTWTEHEQNWEPEIGGIGKESEKVEELLRNRKNLFYFSGHSHMGLCGENSLKKNGYASFEEHDGVNYINMPCLTRPNHHGETEKTGFGCLLEVYGDRVVIRPRDFQRRKMNRKILIKDGKPYFEVKIK